MMWGLLAKGAGWFKTGWSLLTPYRFWIMAVAIGGVFLSVMVFYGNAKANATALTGALMEIQALKIDLTAARVELMNRNERIRDMNMARLRELRETEQMLRQSLEIAQDLRQERDEARLNLEETRFQLLETIQNDEEMADWVDWDVPASAWGLLQQAAEGSTGTGVRTDH